MEVIIRGWAKSSLLQRVFSRDVHDIEQRTDMIVIPSGVTKVTDGGVSVSFLGKANCSAQSNYMFSVRLTDADLLEMVRRRWGIRSNVSDERLVRAIEELPLKEDFLEEEWTSIS